MTAFFLFGLRQALDWLALNVDGVRGSGVDRRRGREGQARWRRWQQALGRRARGWDDVLLPQLQLAC